METVLGIYVAGYIATVLALVVLKIKNGGDTTLGDIVCVAMISLFSWVMFALIIHEECDKLADIVIFKGRNR